jgi:hypothetical protein
MVCKHCEVYSGRLCPTWWEQKKVDPWESFSPVGWAIPIPSLCQWIIEKMCPYGWAYKDYGEMLCLTIWRTIWSIPDKCQDLAKWLFLANDISRYTGVCQEMPPMSETGNINSRDAMPLMNNLQVELFDMWGIDFMGSFPKSKNISWWSWTMCPNGQKQYHVELLNQNMPRECFMKSYFLALVCPGWS